MNLSFGQFGANLQIFAAWAFLCPMWRRRIFILTFSFALAALFVAGCSSNSSNVFQGYIEGEYVYVASPLGGALTNLAVARGDEVKTGQLLFELERGSEAAAVQQAEKNLAQAKANLALSEAEFARRQQLRNDQGVISAEELDQTRAQRDADQAQVESQTAALDKARWSFDQKQQFAPTNALGAGHALSRRRMGRGGQSGRRAVAAGQHQSAFFRARRRRCRKSNPAKRSA